MDSGAEWLSLDSLRVLPPHSGYSFAFPRCLITITLRSLSFAFRKHTIHLILGVFFILFETTNLLNTFPYSRGSVFALSMHLCIWLIDSVFANAFCTGIIGLVYGPVYPSLLALAVDLLPTEAHMLGMAIM